MHVRPFGFDYWKVKVNQGQYHDPYFWEWGKGWKPNNRGARQYKGYVTDITTGFALEFLENRPRKPFGLLLHFKAPHDPFDHHRKYDSREYKEIVEDLKVQLVKLRKEYGDNDHEYPEMDLLLKKYWDSR